MTLETPAGQPVLPNARQHLLGVCLVFAVSVLWVLSAIVIQHIFGERSFNKPYFFTYFSTSFLSLLLCGFIQPSWRVHVTSDTAGMRDYQVVMSEPADQVGRSHRRPGAFQRKRHTVKDVFFFSARILPFYFASCWTYNMGLSLTSISSSSTIGTLTTLFALVLGAFSGTETFNMLKVFGTFLTIAGVAVIGSVDNSSGGSNQVFGDILNVLSSLFYAWYAILVKNKSMTGDMDVAMMQGFLGLLIALVVWPGLVVLNWLGWELFQLPDAHVISILVVNGIVGTLLSEYLWAKSVVLTTPIIGSLALSITIPFSLIADYFVKGLRFEFLYFVGTGMVLAAFLMINMDMVLMRRKGRESVAIPA